MRSLFFAALAAAISLAAPQPVLAWDESGHQIVALIAERHLTPVAKEKIADLMKKDQDLLTAHDIASAAIWADRLRESDRTTTQINFGKTNNWHYANISARRPNIPAACFGQSPLPPGVLASQGPADACVIDKINQFAEELANEKLSEPERIIALKFLLNLVGDIHQPLNVADEDTHHGLGIRVVGTTATPGDLYTYWNEVFVKHLGVDPVAVAEQLSTHIADNEIQAWSGGAPQLWALEAHQMGLDKAYGMLSKMSDDGYFVLDAKDVARSSDLVALQLSRAGIRLAYVLNEALAPSGLPEPKSMALGNAAVGHKFAASACTVCHVLPKQADPRQFTTAPDFEAIANTRGMSPRALHEFLLGTHPTMPNMHLSEKQTANVIAYIMSLKR